MSEPLVSVVTPLGERPDGVRATLDSVLGQTLADWEHLVVDDGGGDDASRALAEASAAHDPRVRHIVRGGRCDLAARNLGITAARAPFVVLLRADEVLAPGCLERRAAVMSRNADLDFAIFQSGYRVGAIDAEAGLASPPQSGDDLCRFLYATPPWTVAATIWRRETLMRLGPFDEVLRGWQDIEFGVRAICAGRHYGRFAEVDHCIGPSSAPGDGAEDTTGRLEAALAAIERMEAHVRAGPGMNWVRQRALCGLYFRVAEGSVDRGELGAGLAAWNIIRKRQLGPAHLHAIGAALLRLQAAKTPTRGLTNQWKGWARLRPLPELAARGASAGQECPVGAPRC